MACLATMETLAARVDAVMRDVADSARAIATQNATIEQLRSALQQYATELDVRVAGSRDEV